MKMSNQELLGLVYFFRLYKEGGKIELNENHLEAKDIIVEDDDNGWDKLQAFEFSQLYVNDQNHSNDTSLPTLKSGDQVSFKISLSTNPRKIFSNIDDLVSSFRPIQQGTMPEEFYLIDEDHLYPSDPDNIASVSKVEKACRFMKFLEKVLPHTEGRIDNHTDLKFVLFSKDFYNTKKSKKIVFCSKFKYSSLPEEMEETGFLESLGSENDLHTYERITIFQNSLVELLSSAQDGQEFVYLLNNLEKLEKIYKSNYAIYINDFHLEEFKKDVVESYTKFSEDIDNKINSLASKIFAIPAVSTAMLFLRTAQSNGVNNDAKDYSLLIYSVILVTFLISYINFQWIMKSFCMIEKNVNEVFGRFEGQEQNGSEFVSNRKNELIGRIEGAAFNGYIFIALVFLLAVIVIIYI